MKIAFVSQYGDSLDIALRMLLDGNEVRCWIKEPRYKENFDGLIKKVDFWQGLVQWADFFVFDDNGCEEVWKAVNKIKPCFGGSSIGAKLEKDRPSAHAIMDRLGLEQIESMKFLRVEQVMAHVKANPKRYVVKPSGKKVESHHVMIGEYEDASDIMALLERFKRMAVPVEYFEVEERKIGLEVAVSAWCAGAAGFVGPVNINFEHKHLCAAELGPLTGEAGTLMRYDTQENPLFLQVLKPMEKMLKAADYRGQIDLNMIATVDGDGKPHYWPLEYTPRLGKPSVFIESELHLTPWSKLFGEIANGRDPGLQTHFDWGVGVVLFAFGFPHEDAYRKVSYELPVMGIEDLDHTHLWQVKEGKDGTLITGMGEGVILTTTGHGESICSAKDRAYAAMSPIRLPNSFYRKDITDKINTWELSRCQVFSPDRHIVHEEL